MRDKDEIRDTRAVRMLIEACESVTQRTARSGAPLIEGHTNAHYGGDDSRYRFDAWASRNGFQQYDTDQDAWYFGAWVNIETRETLTYAEGDLMLVQAVSAEQFKAELDGMAEFYGEAPPAFICYSGLGEGETPTRTEVYDTRPTV